MLLIVCAFASPCGQMKKSDVMVEQNRWRNVHCNAQPAEPSQPAWACWTSVLSILRMHILHCHLFMLIKGIEQRNTIWSLQAQASPCTFPQHWGLLFITPTPLLLLLLLLFVFLSLLACYQARYSADGVPLFLIGWPERSGRGPAAPI